MILVLDYCRRRRCRRRRRLLLNGGCGSLLGQMLLHIPDRVNSPGDCFWMGWWGYAKREELNSHQCWEQEQALALAKVCEELALALANAEQKKYLNPYCYSRFLFSEAVRYV